MALDLAHTPLADLLAPAWFLLCWVGYTYYADGERGQRNLTRVMHIYRALWARQMLERDNRMVDTQIIANLMRSASFFASTTVLIIAGLIAVLGARERPWRCSPSCRSPWRRRRALGPQGAPADSPVRLRILQVHLGVPAVQLLPDPGRLCPGPGQPEPTRAPGSPSASRTSPARPASTPIAASARTTSGWPRSAGSSIPGCSCC